MMGLRRREPMDQLPPHIVSLLVENLHTKNVPAEEEIAVIRKMVAEPTKRLYSLDNEIRRLQAKLSDLVLRKEKLNKGVQACKSLLAPVNRLLPEILQEIFFYCLPSAHNSVMSSKEAPLLLGRVCSKWRQVAFSTPKLWTSIHIIIPRLREAGRTSEALRRQAITAWLSRSGALPLSISVHCTSSGSPGRSGNRRRVAVHPIQTYLDLILPLIHRWKSIYLNLHYYDWRELLLRYNASDLPWLEKLHISGGLLSDESISNSLPSCLPSSAKDNGILFAPRLRVLSMMAYRAQILQFPIRWHELTGLDLSWFVDSLEDTIRALTLCPNLEFCSVIMPDPSASSPSVSPAPTKVVLPKLHTLYVRNMFNASENTHYLFEVLHAPELRHLSYNRTTVWTTPPEGERYYLERLFSTLSLFLNRLVHPLQELDLSAVSWREESVYKMLSLLPGLRRLSLQCDGRSKLHKDWTRFMRTRVVFSFGDQQLTRFTPQRKLYTDEVDALPDGGEGVQSLLQAVPAGCFCPELEVLRCTGAMFSDAGMIKFLRSRSVDHEAFKVARLRRVCVSFGSGRQESKETMRQLDALQKETDIVVNVEYSPPYRPSTKRNDYSPYDGLRLLRNDPPAVLGF